MEKFGLEFQLRFTYLLINDRTFYVSIQNGLSPKYFSRQFQPIVHAIHELYSTHKEKKITVKDIKIYLKSEMETLSVHYTDLGNEKFRKMVLNLLKNLTKLYSDNSNFNHVREKSISFLKGMGLYSSLSNKFEQFHKIRDDANIEQKIKFSSELIKEQQHLMLMGEEQNLGMDVYDFSCKQTEDENSSVITTPYPYFNKYLRDGGLHRGELSMLIGPPGSGKSQFLGCLAEHTFREGLSAIYFSFEVESKYVMERIDTITLRELALQKKEKDRTYLQYTNLTIDQTWEQKNKDALQLLMKKYNKNNTFGQLKVISFPPKYATTNTIMSCLENLYNLYDFEPDLICVDYLKIMKSTTHYRERREELEELARDLRSLAQETDTHVATVHQLNRRWTDDNVLWLSGDKYIAESYRIKDEVDVLMTWNRIDDYIYDRNTMLFNKKSTGFYFLDKNRTGEDKIQFVGELDVKRSKISMYDFSSRESKEIFAEFQSNHANTKKLNPFEDSAKAVLRGGTR